MIAHRCLGLTSRGLMTYLAALGLAKVISEQADPDVRFGWTGDTFVLRTAVPDLAEFLVRDYRPTPIVSPWNGGSGFGPKDKSQRDFVERLTESQGSRLATYRSTINISRDVVARGDAARKPWEKARLIQELRNHAPDDALAWFDASVVLTTDDAAFPPILGTGGNDGRLDYSSNFHQRLIDVLPELGANPKMSRGWGEDLLSGAGMTKLPRAAIGQFDGVGAGGPGSSIFGSADSRVNPWAFVLMLEGVTWFASSAARRLERRAIGLLGELRPVLGEQQAVGHGAVLVAQAEAQHLVDALRLLAGDDDREPRDDGGDLRDDAHRVGDEVDGDADEPSQGRRGGERGGTRRAG